MSDFITQDLLAGQWSEAAPLKSLQLRTARARAHKGERAALATILLMFLPGVDQLRQINTRPQCEWRWVGRCCGGGGKVGWVIGSLPLFLKLRFKNNTATTTSYKYAHTLMLMVATNASLRAAEPPQRWLTCDSPS